MRHACTSPHDERRMSRPVLGGWRMALLMLPLLLQNTKDFENSELKLDLLYLYQDIFVNVERKNILI